MPQRKRVLSGMRPTGRLHIGHYFGALQNWIKMQQEYDCFFFVADWHALTTDYADASGIAQNTLDIATDWLAAGLDPEKCTLFLQSLVPEHAELHLLLSMVTPESWLKRVPTYKEQLENIKDKDLHTYGFLGYPVLQAADIVIYDADLVPVGEDQVPHVELTREVVRRFNTFFGFEVSEELLRGQYGFLLPLVPYSGQGIPAYIARVRRHAAEVGFANFLEKIPNEYQQHFSLRRVLREPEVLLTETPRIPGTDGRKMSKSYDNFVSLGENDESIRAKTKVMMTDPARKRRQDPGNPDVCPVFSWHKLFSQAATIERVNKECRTAEIGCVECKGWMADGLVRWMEPIRARRQEYEAHPDKVLTILDEGSKKARGVAQETMQRVREAVFGWEKTRAGLTPATPPLRGTKDVRAGS